ncbi:unnamed protein product [Effrenium voratum]|nr:unnamed protein product [Effrenium voratum]CAJ1439045.1 unnamed protein product [Effrenium voratum]
MQTIAEIKHGLNYIWGKESDLNETYDFEFSGGSWSCVRTNAADSRKFRVVFDATNCRLWWGQSYFMDPADLAKKPERVQWYRAADQAKSRAAFVWRRLRAKPGAKPGAQAALPRRPEPDRAPRRSPPSKESEKREARTKVPVPLPEIMLDLEEVLVIYKPPHWKVELPAKDAQDGFFLPSWLRERVEGIDPKLFEVESNPALSGTGFGPLSHRIDQETSGPLLAARTVVAHKHLRSQFHKTEVSKRYVCLVHGRVNSPSGVLDASIRTLRTDATTRSEISAAGDWAETQYQTIATFESGAYGGAYSLLACDITSGRTHQIRVHMQHFGHSLVSDDKYASQKLEQDRTWCPRLFLHCYRLCFRDMRRRAQVVICPLPDDLKAALTRLGAAECPSDLLFEETSWQREVFRPPHTSWRPGTEVQRHVASILSKVNEPVLLGDLNADPELKRLLAKENINGINKAWLAKNWHAFEVLNVHDEAALSLKLRPTEGPELLEQQIEAVRSEVEELQRQKQRAVAEEQYLQAAEIKRRVEAAAAELSSLLALEDTEDGGPARPAPKPAQSFQQDVRDEALFPSLGAPKLPSKPELEDVGEGQTEVPSLQEAILTFLDRKEGSICHINEINNDRSLKEVMAMQVPKATAVNKAWLKQHEDAFTLFRGSDNEMYVVKTQAVRDQKAKAKAKADAKKMPAYHQVIQKADVDAAPLVYEYGSNKKPEDGQAPTWQDKFREVLQAGRLTAPELLARVPLFAPAMGASRPRQQQDLLVTFLQTWPDLFKVEKQGSGTERQYVVSLK